MERAGKPRYRRSNHAAAGELMGKQRIKPPIGLNCSSMEKSSHPKRSQLSEKNVTSLLPFLSLCSSERRRFLNSTRSFPISLAVTLTAYLLCRSSQSLHSSFIDLLSLTIVELVFWTILVGLRRPEDEGGKSASGARPKSVRRWW
jgi:hypothetical protein